MNNKVKAIALAVAVVILTVWIYHVYRKNVARDATVAAVRDTAERMRRSLAPEPRATADAQRDSAAVDAHVKALRARDTSPIRAFGDAADDYLVTAREILRREAALRGAGERFTLNLDALTDHIQSDRGGADWTQTAVRLRAELDREAREIRIATESYTSLLDALPGSQAKVAPYVDASRLVDAPAVKAARERALDGLARTEENVRRVTKLR